VLPPIAQVGSTTAPSRFAQTVISATFTPARLGRPVVLTRQHGDEWVVVDQTRLSRAGLAEFTARTRRGGDPVRYRVTALPDRGLDMHHSAAVWSTAWGAPDFVDEFDGAALDARWSHRIQFHNPLGRSQLLQGVA
ncbi:MAG: hypothetical protein ACR2JD_08060, partial [Nocardioides sp.]